MEDIDKIALIIQLSNNLYPTYMEVQFVTEAIDDYDEKYIHKCYLQELSTVDLIKKLITELETTITKEYEEYKLTHPRIKIQTEKER